MSDGVYNARPRHTSFGGSKPNDLALSHRSNLVMPTQGPYSDELVTQNIRLSRIEIRIITYLSNTRKISWILLLGLPCTRHSTLSIFQGQTGTRAHSLVVWPPCLALAAAYCLFHFLLEGSNSGS